MTFILRYLVILSALSGFLPSVGVADPIVVSSIDSYDEQTLELAPGETAEVAVYLRSAGELVSGVIVVLTKADPPQWERETVTEAAGIGRFRSLGPGVYRVRLKHSKELDSRISVGIGDITLKPSKSRE